MSGYLITYGLMTLYYSLFFATIAKGYKNRSGRLKDILSGKGGTDALLIRMISGLFLLGICTVTIFTTRNIDTKIFILAADEYPLLVWILIIAAIATGVLSALKKISPVTSSDHSIPSYLPLSFVMIRTLFLIAYECFFRGVMLFVMIEDLGLSAAVVLNLFLYMLVHWFYKEERYGSLLMGLILCGVSIYSLSVWPAIFIHLSLALSHEITLLINNKSLIKKSWS